jgi:hypothetical protein
MTDESPLDADLRKGRAADRLLSDETLTGAFDSLKAEYLAAWESTKYNDTDGRERLWQAYQIVGKVRTHLANIAAGGKLAQAEIDQVARLGERKKIFGVV